MSSTAASSSSARPDLAVRSDELTKDYFVNNGPRLLLGEVTDRLMGRTRQHPLRALDHVSFDLERGKTLGVIGINGAGKSTMLRLISGISTPTSGCVHVKGRVASLLEFGAGFEGRLSARENVFLNGLLLGIPRPTLVRELPAILEWADVSDHADAPLYTFSSGMAMRLGFAIAINTDADILLFDEVLAVGDVAFQAKCLRTIEQFKRGGKTIVFVSHDLYDVGNLCDEVLLLNHGRVEAHGPPHEVIQRYWSALVQEDSRASVSAETLRVDFVNGKLYVWSGTVPLTKGFCGYTSVRSFVRWHESDKAAWRVLERSPTRVTAEGTYWGLPLKQHWVLEVDGAVVSWTVDIEALEPLRLERQQANFMLSEAYETFLRSDGSDGPLGAFRHTVDDEWQVLYSCPTGMGAVGFRAVAPRLPEVRFEASAPEPGQELAVVNSDANFRGRLLQCRRTQPCELAAGERRPLFRGRLHVAS